MNKVVILGGGTGLSSLLKSLKNYPLDLTAVVAIWDDGSSTEDHEKNLIFQL